MPIDGAGIISLGDDSYRRLAKAWKRHLWKRLPFLLRPFGLIGARLAWLFICPIQVFIGVRKCGDPVPLRTALLSLWLGWTRGSAPFLFLTRCHTQCNTLDDRQGALLLDAIGNDRDKRLSSDKLETTMALLKMGLPVAPILATIDHQTSHIDFSASPWADNKKLFIKPRQGHAAQGALSVERSGDNCFKIGTRLVAQVDFLEVLAMLAARHPMLVQPFIKPGPSTFDISQHTAPWLRIFVYRSPGGPAKLLSSALKILPPGKDVERNIGSILMAPIDPDSQTLMDGMLPSRPKDRFSHIPWNGARLRGRRIAEWEASIEMAIKGSTLLPDVPVIGWDVLLSEQGPVILEPNTGISLEKAQLWYFETGTPSPLIKTLHEWIEPRRAS